MQYGQDYIVLLRDILLASVARPTWCERDFAFRCSMRNAHEISAKCFARLERVKHFYVLYMNVFGIYHSSLNMVQIGYIKFI